MRTITTEDLQQIPFIDHANINGRIIRSLSFYSDGEWHFWLNTERGLFKIKGTPGEALYFGEEPEREDDIHLHFIDFICQRAYWSSVTKPVEGLISDVYNVAASLAKLSLLATHAHDQSRMGLSRMVTTELEYLFSTCRSMFDLLQETIAALWKTVRLLDESITKRSLPTSFSDVVFKAGRPQTAAEIQQRYGLPQDLALFYEESTPFFTQLRSFRDNIIHRGSTFEVVYVTERGFAVHEKLRPFCDFGVWDEPHKLPNGLCSLRPAASYVVLRTLEACDRFSRRLESCIQFPPPIAPGFRIFVRGFCNHELASVNEVIGRCLWWNTIEDAPAPECEAALNRATELIDPQASAVSEGR